MALNDASAPSIPAFPEISSAWEGFCIPHARLVGVHHRLIEGVGVDEEAVGPLARDALAMQRRRLTLIFLHEDGHYDLTKTPMGSVLADKARETGQMAVSSLTGPRSAHAAKVVVPLAPDVAGSDLQVLCADLTDLSARLALVQEVFAVWHSLDAAQELDMLSAVDRAALERSVPKRYEPLFKGFTNSFLALSQLADRSDVAARFVVVWSLCTEEPNEAFKAMLARATSVLSDLDRDAPWSNHESVMETILEAASVYIRLGDNARYLKAFDRETLMASAHDYADDPSEQQPFLCYFGAFGINLQYEKILDPSEREAIVQSTDAIFHESIRQQLMCGDGLRCPFWVDPMVGCCTFSRPQLELIWRHTVHRERDEGRWRRQGCLTDALSL